MSMSVGHKRNEEKLAPSYLFPSHQKGVGAREMEQVESTLWWVCVCLKDDVTHLKPPPPPTWVASPAVAAHRTAVCSSAATRRRHLQEIISGN